MMYSNSDKGPTFEGEHELTMYKKALLVMLF